MKRIYLIIAVTIISYGAVSGQQETDTGKPREMMTLTGPYHTGGGYGGFTTGFSMIDERHAYEFGFRGMWIINHSFGMGFGGTGFANQPVYNSTDGTDNFLTGGYGGLVIEPIIAPMFPVHLSFPILLGGGGASYIETDWDIEENFLSATEFFFLIQPGAEIELNVARFFRIGIGAAYRFTTDFDTTNNGIPGFSSEDIKGFSYFLSFKFGKF